MTKYAVIGHPISHSKSPTIHNHWIKKYDLDGVYGAYDIAPKDFENDIAALIRDGFMGFNLTVPHKQMALPLCDELDENAKAVGAVNTIYIKDGRVCGTNTDIFGFIQNIKDGAEDFDFTAGAAVVLGAGGAARAAVYGLLQEGAPEIIITNRTREKAENFTAFDSEKIKIVDWDERSNVLNAANLLVNTTSLGMAGQPSLDIDLTALPQRALVNDIVYAPLMSPLLNAANERGNAVVTGIGMLLQQARPAFEHWFGILPDIDDALIEKVLA